MDFLLDNPHSARLQWLGRFKTIIWKIDVFEL